MNWAEIKSSDKLRGIFFKLIALGVLGVIGLGVACWYFELSFFDLKGFVLDHLGETKQYAMDSKDYLRDHSWILFIALVVLPGLFVPVSPMFLLSGPVFGDGENYFKPCLIVSVALALNITWTYWLAKSPCRKLIEYMLKGTPIELPDMKDGGYVGVILFLRTTVPLAIQNYFLGLLGIPFKPYFFISMPPLIIVGCVYVVLGDAVFQGDGKLLLTGMLALGVVSGISSFIHRKFAKKKVAKIAE